MHILSKENIDLRKRAKIEGKLQNCRKISRSRNTRCLSLTSSANIRINALLYDKTLQTLAEMLLYS